jgi:hypothetical protein
MTGQELDTELRRILMAATKDTVLTSAQAVQKLMKCSGVAALTMVADIIRAKEERGL